MTRSGDSLAAAAGARTAGFAQLSNALVTATRSMPRQAAAASAKEQVTTGQGMTRTCEVAKFRKPCSAGVIGGQQAVDLVSSGHAELGEGSVQVGGDRSRGQIQALCDLAVGQALGGEPDDLALLRREHVQPGRSGQASGDRDSAGAKFRFGATPPWLGLQRVEYLERSAQDRLGVVDAASSAQPFAVFEVELCVFKGH
jgi:hypothetical protein